jgi:hypothetical protein
LFKPKANKKAIEAAMQSTSEIDDLLSGLELRKKLLLIKFGQDI